MASADPEKQATNAADDDDARRRSSSGQCKTRGRLLLWLAVLFVALLAFMRMPSTWCRPGELSLAQRWTSRVDQDHREPHSQGIKSRSPTVKSRETTATTSTVAPTRTVLKTFEVAPPVLMPDGPADSDGSTRHGKDYSPELCTVLLMRHDFAWSYNAPFVGNYTPPDCEFNRVVLNFSAVSHGRQYDRLAIMYFGDTEVWRTSTAQPTVPPGISWIYLKDMSEYMYFWKSPQKIIFDLGNLINDRYTGIFNTTMTAIFYNSDVVTDQGPPSDLIIPISARQGANDSVSQFTVPAQNATNTISLPRNVRRAVFSISANGQATEEFWWSNVLQSDMYTFNATAGAYPGYSPFREVQLLIDGQLAGVQWPFPVIFTGGVVPSLHRPIVGINAFDLKEQEIDITPFLPLLCDGAEHTFTIRIAGLDDDPADSSSVALTESVNDSWYVTGKIFLWLDENPDSITTGEPPTLVLSPPAIAVTRAVTTNGTANETLTYTTSVQRSLRITSSRVSTQHASSPASWSQSLSYTNYGLLTAFGYSQVNDLVIAGDDRASFSGGPSYQSAYRYPLFANSTYAVSAQGNLSIWAHVVQGKEVRTSGPGVFPTGLEAFADEGGRERVARLNTTKEGIAEFRQSGDARESSGWGGSAQVLWFGAGTEELYFRNVSAVNGSVVYDYRRMDGEEVGGGEEGEGSGEENRVMGVGDGDGLVFAQRTGTGRVLRAVA
ncbi:hypothetical protein MFIFM68171_04083 [Madurella fahalii]|uniref:Peptide N-acetyl-beta-D-glucosaminyl asparaginase amidase A N-terminal domain-containing protein n=1 Tax=Madurella fahalii TaxID=1157608 RepID=A0ABQ0G7Y7_9PEZI